MPVLFWLLASSTMLQSAPQATPSPLGQAYFLFLEGRALEGRGEFDAAIRTYRQVLEIVPAAADVHAELAALFARQGRASESVEEARRATAIDPENQEANRILGFVLATIGEQRRDTAMQDQAIGHFETALATGGRDPASALTLGRLAVRRGRYPLAIKWLNEFLLDQAGYPEAMELLAEAYEGSGRPAEAAALVEELVASSRDQVRTRSWLAELHEAAGDWTRAAAVWRELESASPSTPTYAIRRAMAVANGGDFEAARGLLGELAVRESDNLRIWYLLSQVERRAGNVDGAVAAAERIRAIDADSPFGLVALAEARLAGRDPGRAITLLEARVAAGRSDDVESGMFTRMAGLLASALQESGETTRAVTVLEAASARVSDDDDLLFNLGAAFDRDGRFAEAERVFRNIITRDPGYADALNYLGYLLADRGERLDEAVALISRALEVERDNPSYLDSLGWARYRQGDFVGAREPLERAAAALPRTSVVQDHLGDLYLELKQYREAVAAFDRALAGDRMGIDAAEVQRKRARAHELAGGR